MEPVIIPITDELDLHTFRPGEVSGLLKDYLEECRKAGIFSVRIIHGKGTGVLAKSVHSCLSKNPMVRSFRIAPPQSGGWGATVVELETKK
ncbi:Smr protein/MutS2 [Desulfatibacillum aliphaticivorans]|uniref:Smr protein/MutS2 n=1 Tax=Desulfatibacillum aliphaticivorans TaxID=218208 RepID=B8FAT2_DESAL|nr:Smr/MutS family protein [Desulfatibacillum aliphaticivorans]ACL03378.1 Smr protein/MutS2 [Desulfatibacillum aliphaticivorans]